MKIAIAVALTLVLANQAWALDCRPTPAGWICPHDDSDNGYTVRENQNGFTVEPRQFNLNPYRYANPFRHQWNWD